MHQEYRGIVRSVSYVFFDSSWTYDACNETANVLVIRKVNENQKYNLVIKKGIGLKVQTIYLHWAVPMKSKFTVNLLYTSNDLHAYKK